MTRGPSSTYVVCSAYATSLVDRIHADTELVAGGGKANYGIAIGLDCEVMETSGLALGLSKASSQPPQSTKEADPFSKHSHAKPKPIFEPMGPPRLQR